MKKSIQLTSVLVNYMSEREFYPKFLQKRIDFKETLNKWQKQ